MAVLYHFFHPDDVVSARQFTDLCADLQARGWDVEAMPCNRSCHKENESYSLQEAWNGVAVHRVWRPPLRQSSAFGRVVNALWMLAIWSTLGLRRKSAVPDVVVVGTDPILSVLVAWVIRKLNRRIKLAHWCFDLYPEAAVAEGLLRADGWITRFLRHLTDKAYASCNLVVDIGPCMRCRLQAYKHGARSATLSPWSLVEPNEVTPRDPESRRELFSGAALGLLYSGHLGRAHSFGEFLDLARMLRGESIQFCFGVRGNRLKELQAAISDEDSNVRLAGFGTESLLAERLAAADIHLVSLRPEWSGLVVPSKFFGALAVGRPVLFAGPRDSSVARWIEEHGVGWVLNETSAKQVALELRDLSVAPDQLTEMGRHCFRVYQEHFSRHHVTDGWHRELLALLQHQSAHVRSLKQGRRRS